MFVRNRRRMILTVGILWAGYLGFATLRKRLLHNQVWSFQVARSKRSSRGEKHVVKRVPSIYMRVYQGSVYTSPVYVIPMDSFQGFWKLLDVRPDDWDNFHSARLEGRRVPLAPTFPLLSELTDVVLGNLYFSREQLGELQAEVETVLFMQLDAKDNAVLAALDKGCTMALREYSGLGLSPFF